MYRHILLSGFHTTVVVLWLFHSSLSLQTVQVAVGQTARLHCMVEITGDINIEWFNSLDEPLTLDKEVLTQDQRFAIRQPYVKEWILEISNVRSSDAGVYRCRIGPHLEINRRVELIVTIPPEITDTSGAGSYVLNSTVTLSCVAKGVPEPKITWHRIENHLLIELNVEGIQYVIQSVDLSAAGVYECHASNKVLQTAKAALEVDVLFAPIVKVPYQEVIQEEGAWTQFSCLVTANPKAESYWIRNGGRVENSSSYTISSQNISPYQHLLRLSIEILSYSDFGKYECYAENRYGKDKSQMTLSGEQRKKAVVISKPRDVTTVVGEDVLFNCSVVHLPKDDQIVWWHRSANATKKLFEFQSLTHNSKKKTSERTENSLENGKYDVIGQYNLLVRKANFSDEGLYICQITGHENLSATLDVIAVQDSSLICQEYQREPFDLNTMLIVLGVVVIVLLVVAIVVIVLVCRLLVQRSRKNAEYFHPVQLNSKVVRIDQ